jgi:hypothetical protein
MIGNIMCNTNNYARPMINEVASILAQVNITMFCTHKQSPFSLYCSTSTFWFHFPTCTPSFKTQWAPCSTSNSTARLPSIADMHIIFVYCYFWTNILIVFTDNSWYQKIIRMGRDRCRRGYFMANKTKNQRSSFFKKLNSERKTIFSRPKIKWPQPLHIICLILVQK